MLESSRRSAFRLKPFARCGSLSNVQIPNSAETDIDWSESLQIETSDLYHPMPQLPQEASSLKRYKAARKEVPLATCSAVPGHLLTRLSCAVPRVVFPLFLASRRWSAISVERHQLTRLRRPRAPLDQPQPLSGSSLRSSKQASASSVMAEKASADGDDQKGDQLTLKAAGHRSAFQKKAILEEKLSEQRKTFVEAAASERDAGAAPQRISAPPCSDWLSFLSVLLVFPLQTIQLCLAAFFVLLYYVPASRLPLACYVAYAYLDKAPANGGWRGGIRRYLRRLSVWKYASAYYPMELVKTSDLDPSKSYVFGYHPHGLFGAGACNLFGCNALGFDELFPGVDVTLMTLKATFLVPFFREWILAHGISSCDKETCIKLLKNNRSIALIIGGARESLDSRPGAAQLSFLAKAGRKESERG
eukprot:scaffold977_cov253-Pinguiococcus_pyrenoidosus.AAC.10